MSDEFLRLLLCRHVFASVVLRVHRSFRARPKNHPTAHPPLPDLDVVDNPTLQRYTLDLAMQGHSALETMFRIHFCYHLLLLLKIACPFINITRRISQFNIAKGPLTNSSTSGITSSNAARWTDTSGGGDKGAEAEAAEAAAASRGTTPGSTPVTTAATIAGTTAATTAPSAAPAASATATAAS